VDRTVRTQTRVRYLGPPHPARGQARLARDRGRACRAQAAVKRVLACIFELKKSSGHHICCSQLYPVMAAQKPIALPRNNINTGSNKTTADRNKPARKNKSRYASGWRSLMMACHFVRVRGGVVGSRRSWSK